MKKIVIAQFKGGTGKSTLAINLAATFSKDCMTSLIDLDHQKTASFWGRNRKAKEPKSLFVGFDELNNTLSLLEKNDYEITVIDTPGFYSDNLKDVFAIADLVIIPVRPSLPDLLTVPKILELVEDRPHKICVVMALKKALETVDVVEVLKNKFNEIPFGTIITNRQSYIRAFSKSLAVTETSLDFTAKREINNLVLEVYKFIRL
jgi:chromosome partitioning protein